VAMTLLLGVMPTLVTDLIGPSVGALIDHVHASVPAEFLSAAADTVTH
jgi:NADH-quinone oxidoreductase subunit M